MADLPILPVSAFARPGASPPDSAGPGRPAALRWVVLGVLVGLGLPGAVRAWSAPTHRRIALHALRRLPAARRPPTLAAREAFLLGVDAPDRHGDGWIPSRAHVLHPDQDPGGGLAARTVGRLVAWLREADRRDLRWWFHAGRLCHLVADLAQPMHSASDPRERRWHAGYERWANRLEPAAPTRADRARPSPLTEPGLLALARASRADYAGLLEGLEGGRRDQLAGPTRGWMARGVAATGRALAGLEGPADADHGAWWVAVLCWGALAWAARRREAASLRG